MDEFKKEFDMTSGDGAENSGTEKSGTRKFCDPKIIMIIQRVSKRRRLK